MTPLARRAAGLLLALSLAGHAIAEETLALKGGQRIQVKSLFQSEGKVYFETTAGERRSVDAARVEMPALDAIPFLLRLKSGGSLLATRPYRSGGTVRFEATDGAAHSVVEAEVELPRLDSLPTIPPRTAGTAPPAAAATLAPTPEPPQQPSASATVSTQATEGDQALVLATRAGQRQELRVRQLVRNDRRVFFETTAGERRSAAERDVISPSLDSIPFLLRLTDGTSITVRRLVRGNGRVAFETTGGEQRSVAEDRVASPRLAAIPAATPVRPPSPPRPAPTPAPPAVVPAPPVAVPAAPPPPVPPLPALSPRLIEFVPVPGRWDLLDALMDQQKLPTGPRLVRGRGLDPYNQNKLKGDKPVIGDSVFFVLTATLETPLESRRLPLPSGVSTEDAGSLEFFGRGDQLFTSPRALVSLELFKGQTAFRPKTFSFKATGAANLNYLRLKERNGVNIDVREGKTRRRQDASLEEAFAEVKLFDVSPKFDAVSVRAGIQTFVSDFRGLIFSDSNLGARLFGNLSNNRWQYNAAYFDLLEKETNSELNLFEKRDQKVFIANLFRQDFLTRGFTFQASFHRNQDEGSVGQHYDANGFLVRPAKIGSPRPHDLTANYIGIAGDGHLGRLNLTHAAYWAFGRDENNPLSGKQDIHAQMVALEASVDRDWARFKASGFFASGDDDARDGEARGFDTINDLTNFAGGPFSFWNRSGIPLTQTGVLLKTPGSLLPSLRSNKFEGQASFVNPGVLLVNAALDLDLTPKLKGVLNANYLRFHKTGALGLLLFQPGIRKDIGIDLGAGIVYRPKLSENIVISAGLSGLLPGAAFDDLFSSTCSVPSCGATSRKLWNSFVTLKLTY